MKPASITILRWGLAFVFFYAGIAALRTPAEWIGYVPGFVASIIAPNVFITLFSVYEIILAAWLFWGRMLFWSSLLATITLAGIVVFDFNAIEIVFRDIGLAFAGLSLFEMSREARTTHDVLE